MKSISNYAFAIHHVLGVVIFSWIIKGVLINIASDLLISKLGAEAALEFLFSWKGNLIKLAIWVLCISIGVFLSLYFLKKKYVFENVDKIIGLSVIFFVIILFIRDSIILLIYRNVYTGVEISSNIIWTIINIGVISLVFYLLTKAKIRKVGLKKEFSDNY